MKASVIEPVGSHGGMNPYDFSLCRGLCAAGVDAALFTSDLPHGGAPPGFSVRPAFRGIFGKSPVWLRGFRYLRGTATFLLQSVLEGRRVCHFHFFSVGPLEFMNVALARLLGRKVVITAHDVESFVRSQGVQGLPRFVYRMAQAVIAHNLISRSELMKKIGVPASKIHVIPAGNHLTSLDQLPSTAEARLRLGLRPDVPVLLFFGQIKEVKGLDLLLEALPAILAAHPDTTLLIAGRPWKTDFSGYQAQMDRLGIGPNCVAHVRYIEDEDLPHYYQACDLIALPYRRIYQSDVVLMAMSFGRPVVTSDIPGMTELVRDGETGFIFRSEDPASLAEAVNRALGAPELREAVASRARELMNDRHSWDAICRATSEVYRSCP